MRLPLYALFAYMVARTLTAQDIPMAFWGPYLDPFGSLLSVMVLLLVFETAAYWKPTKLQVARAVMSAGILTAGFGFMEAQGFNPLSVHLLSGRAGGTIGNPVFLSAALVPCFLCGLWLHEQGKETRRTTIIGCSIIALGIISTGSRGGTIGCAIATLVFYLA